MHPAVIVYHKNVFNYPKRLTDKCVESIVNQTYKDFCLYEIDYGAQGNRLFENKIANYKSFDIEFPTHADAHNFLLDEVFKNGHDCAFNVNVDDFYDIKRFEKQ